MQSIRREMQRLAEAPSNVLITGRSGTGKELVARGIHRLSSRRSHPFIAVNCPALSHGLIESELFGHEKGAFTGADMKHVGKFEQVDEGTLFLDEITEIPIEVQSKLLRVLQEREFERVGGRHLLPFRGRILASSNRDVDQAVIDGKLREDLLYRLNVTQIHLPPLSQRRDDIPLLVDYFVRIKALEMKKKPPLVSEEAMGLLCSHDWPGNVRELSNCIENAIVYTDREILDMSDLSRCLMHGQLIGTYEESKKKFMAEFQRNYIRVMLQRNHGNLTRTAEEMGVTRQGLSKMMKSCGLEEEDDD
jgi:DNA-binding NtrC family response regulator